MTVRRCRRVDVAFAIEGRSLPRDHAQALADALQAQLPWLRGHPTAGIHGIKLVPGTEAEGWLSRRARLLLRVPRSHVPALAPLAGCTLGLAEPICALATPRPHELVPHATLYAYFVAAGATTRPPSCGRCKPSWSGWACSRWPCAASVSSAALPAARWLASA